MSDGEGMPTERDWLEGLTEAQRDEESGRGVINEDLDSGGEWDFEGHRFNDESPRCVRCGVLIGVASEAPWPVDCIGKRRG